MFVSGAVVAGPVFRIDGDGTAMFHVTGAAFAVTLLVAFGEVIVADRSIWYPGGKYAAATALGALVSVARRYCTTNVADVPAATLPSRTVTPAVAELVIVAPPPAGGVHVS
jgi:hypothetical protein